jgi:hypothetical protein
VAVILLESDKKELVFEVVVGYSVDKSNTIGVGVKLL